MPSIIRPRMPRTEEAAKKGIRIVPSNPDPKEFPKVWYACEIRPVKCDMCTIKCALRSY